MTGRPFVALCLLAALAACSPEAVVYRNPIDRLLTDYGRLAGFSYWPCGYATEGTFESLDDEDCYRFDRPQRMRGVWVTASETSEYFANATRSPAVWDFMRKDETRLKVDWQTIERQLPPPIRRDDAGHPDRLAAYAVEFIGRPMTYRAVYGDGYSYRIVVLDTLLSARAIVPPRQPGRQERLAEHRRRVALAAAAPPEPVWRRVKDFFLSLWTMAPGGSLYEEDMP